MSTTPEKRLLSLQVFNPTEYTLLQYIKYGRFGNYHYAKNLKKESKTYFFRIFKKSVLLEKNLTNKLLKEIELYEKLSKSKFFPKILGIVTGDPKYLALVFDFIPGGKLKTLLNQKKKFSLEEVKFYLSNMILILEYLHKNQIIFRDLKPSNLLIRENGYLTPLDITFAKQIKNNKDLTYTLCGTPNYLAPEIILNKGYNYSVDFWSLGVILFQMLVGRDPFYSSDPMLIYQNILINKIKFPKVMDRDAKTLINHLLVPEPSKRYGCLTNGINDIKNHRLFNDFPWKYVGDLAWEAPFKPIFAEKEIFSKYYDEEKSNVKLKEKCEQKKAEYEKIKAEDKASQNLKKGTYLEGTENINSDEEAKELEETEDPFLNW